MPDDPLQRSNRAIHGRTPAQVLVSLVALLFVVPATFYFVYWVPFSFVPGGQSWIATVVSLACAFAVGRFVWEKLAEPGGLMFSVLLGAALGGGLGFSGGFFGPIIFTPEANQGPLLGIFITGPLGFLVGAIAGSIHWHKRARETPRPGPGA